jgi:hypothetical protein
LKSQNNNNNNIIIISFPRSISIEDAPVNVVEHWWWRDKLKNLRYNSIAEIKQKRGGGGELLLLENVFWVYIVVFL